MSALQTIQNILEWAIDNPQGGFAPPTGGFYSLDNLSSVPDSVSTTIQRLCAITSARLNLGTPPLDDPKAMSPDILILALALSVGIQQRDLCEALLESTAPASSASDYVVRHGLVFPAIMLPGLLGDLTDKFLVLSPLTALLHHPLKSRNLARSLATRMMLPHPLGRSLLVRTFAFPVANDDIATREWRSWLLEQFVRGTNEEKAFVLDVYEAVSVLHNDEHQAQLAQAQAIFADSDRMNIPRETDFAVSVGRWWKPLWLFRRQDKRALLARLYLQFDSYKEGVKLYAQHAAEFERPHD